MSILNELFQDEVTAESAVLRRAAAQVLGLMLEARPQTFSKKKKMKKLIGLLREPLIRASKAVVSPDDAAIASDDSSVGENLFTESKVKETLAIVNTFLIIGDEDGVMSASGAKLGVEYYSLRVIEKALTLDSNLAADGVSIIHTILERSSRSSILQHADGMWKICDALLVADHAWIRTVSARILGLHFATWQQQEAGLASLSAVKPGMKYLLL